MTSGEFAGTQSMCETFVFHTNGLVVLSVAEGQTPCFFSLLYGNVVRNVGVFRGSLRVCLCSWSFLSVFIRFYELILQ